MKAKSSKKAPLERKNPAGAANQLARRLQKAEPPKGATVLHFKAPATKLDKAVKKAVKEATKAGVPTVSKGMLGKIRRAFRRLGKPEDEVEISDFAIKLFDAGVDIMSKTSRRISKAVSGEIKIEDLK